MRQVLQLGQYGSESAKAIWAATIGATSVDVMEHLYEITIT